MKRFATSLISRLARSSAAMREGYNRALAWTLASTPVLAHLARPHLVMMPIVFAGAVGVAAAVLPGETERIAAFERDGQTRKALQMLEARYDSGDRSTRIVFDLHRLYDYYGDTDKARVMLEHLAEQRPRDAVIQRQLAQLYKATQDESAYVRALTKQISLRYSEPACKEVIGIHRLNSRYADEQAMIKQCRSLGYRRADDLIRLAFLDAADGNVAETAQTLTAVDDRKWLRDPAERQLLFASLIDTNRPEEAVRRGVRWMRGRLDEEFANDLIYKLMEERRNDLAMQMASAISQPGDAVALTVGEIMLGQSQPNAARAFLRGWLQNNRAMDLAMVKRFARVALAVEDAPLALEGANKFGLDKMGQADLDRLAETLIASARGREFDTVRQHLTTETIARNPLLSAGIELRLGRNEFARSNLMRVRLDDLDERRLGHFVRLVDQAGRSPALAAVLREPRFAAIAAPEPPRQSIVGPAQKQVRQGLQKGADAKKKVGDRRKAEARKGAAPGAPSAPFTPFTVYPQQ